MCPGSERNGRPAASQPKANSKQRRTQTNGQPRTNFTRHHMRQRKSRRRARHRSARNNSSKQIILKRNHKPHLVRNAPMHSSLKHPLGFCEAEVVCRYERVDFVLMLEFFVCYGLRKNKNKSRNQLTASFILKNSLRQNLQLKAPAHAASKPASHSAARGSAPQVARIWRAGPQKFDRPCSSLLRRSGR